MKKVSGLVVHFPIVQIIRVEIFSTSMVLTEIQQALEQRDYNRAKELAEQHLVGSKRVNMGPICPFGDIHIEFSNQGQDFVSGDGLPGDSLISVRRLRRLLMSYKGTLI